MSSEEAIPATVRAGMIMFIAITIALAQHDNTRGWMWLGIGAALATAVNVIAAVRRGYAIRKAVGTAGALTLFGTWCVAMILGLLGIP